VDDLSFVLQKPDIRELLELLRDQDADTIKKVVRVVSACLPAEENGKAVPERKADAM